MNEDRVYTDKQRAFLECLFDNECKGNISAAKVKAGYSESTPNKMITDALTDEIAEVTRKFIATATTESAYALFDILRSPARVGNREKMAAAKDLLDRAGLVKTEKVEVTTKEPVFILPAKKEECEDSK
jgi:hypothetical protein